MREKRQIKKKGVGGGGGGNGRKPDDMNFLDIYSTD